MEDNKVSDQKEFWRWKEYRWHNENIDWKSANVISVGVDIGSVSSQAVILADGELYAFSNQRTGFDSPESEPYDRYVIKLHAKASALLQEHSDVVLFANYRISSKRRSQGTGAAKFQGMRSSIRRAG